MMTLASFSCLVIAFVCLLNSFVEADELRYIREQNLRKDKLNDYDRMVAPNAPVDVTVSLNIYKITAMSMADGVLEFNGWVTLSWADKRLAWDSSDSAYENITQTYYRAEPFGGTGDTEVWTPDLDLYNFYNSFTEFVPKVVVAYPSGNVWWAPPGIMRAICSFDNIEYFPFDEPSCRLDFGGWTQSGPYVNFIPGMLLFQETEAANYGFSSYDVQKEKSTVELRHHYYNCCPNEPWPIVGFTIHLTRASRFFVTSIILPNVLFTYLSFAVLFSHVSCGERLGVGATLLLAISAVDIITSSYIPKSNKWLWINYLTVWSILFSVLAILESCLITALYWKSVNFTIKEEDKDRDQAWPVRCLSKINLFKLFKISSKTKPQEASPSMEEKKNDDIEKQMHVITRRSTIAANARKPDCSLEMKKNAMRRASRVEAMNIRSLQINNFSTVKEDDQEVKELVEKVESDDRFHDNLDKVLVWTLLLMYTTILIYLFAGIH